MTTMTQTGIKTDKVELEIAMNCNVEVAVSELVKVDGTPTPYFWELWKAEYTQNKRWMRQFGLQPTKENGRWMVKGVAA
jgi:hypothetical protein